MPPGDRVGEGGRRLHASFPQQGGPTHGVDRAFDGRFDAPAGEGPEAAGDCDASPLLGRGDDCPGQRVLAVGLDAAGDAQHLVLGEALGRGHAGYHVGPPRQRAGLVEQDCVDRAHPLEGKPVLDQDPGPGRHGGRQRYDERDGESEGVWAGDHQHRHGANHGVVGVAQRQPHQERHHSGAGRDVEQQRREPIGQGLGTAAARLRLGDQSLDAGQRRVVTHGVDAHANGRVGGDCAGDHLVAGRLGDRPRLAGDHGFVQLGVALDDLAVGRDPRARTHQHDVAAAQVGEGDGRHLAVGSDTVGLVGQEFGQRRQGTLGLADGLHLLPVAQQHDRDQCRQLPPELEVQPVEARGHRGAVGDDDRHRDEQHHPRLACPQLGHTPG